MNVYIKKAEYEEVKEYADDIVEQMIDSCMDKLSMEFDKEENVEKEINEFCSTLEKFYMEVEKAQQQGRKGPINKICIYYMKSYSLTHCHPFKIYAYDEKGPSDKFTCCIDWDCNCVMKFYETDMENLENKLKSKFIQISNDIFFRLRSVYLLAYCIVVLDYLGNVRELFDMTESFDRIQVDDLVPVTFGEYLEEGEVFYRIMEEES